MYKTANNLLINYSCYLYNVFIVRHVNHVTASVKCQVERVGSRQLRSWYQSASINPY